MRGAGAAGGAAAGDGGNRSQNSRPDTYLARTPAMSTSAVLTARSESELVATLSANAGKLCVCFIYQSSVASNVAHADTFSRIAAELAGDAVFIKVGTGGPEGSLGHNQLIELAQRRRFKTTPTTLLYLANELKVRWGVSRRATRRDALLKSLPRLRPSTSGKYRWVI